MLPHFDNVRRTVFSSPALRALRKLMLLAIALFTSTSLARAQQVVISQVYSGGSGAVATFNRDYVELYNRGTTSVALSTWSLQVATSTGSTWTRTNLTSVATPAATIAPGGYFLVQMTTSGTTGAVLPTPDFVATTNSDLATVGGKVALVNNQVTLPSATFFVQGANGVVDFVGYGQTSPSVGPNGFEGSGGTSGALSPTLAAFRADNGCQDLQDNALDFTAAVPAPRNSASPTFSCTPTGGCCNGMICTYTTAGLCTGTYQGDFGFCGPFAYSGPTTPLNPLDDISTTGTPITALDNADDTASPAIVISPAFPLFGQLRNQMTVNSNGYVSFLPEHTGATAAQMRNNAAFPSGGALPNNMIAPLWDDFVVRTSTIAGARVYTEQKTSPNRLIIQWNKVSTFNSGTTTPDNMTFQAILNQDDGSIEFRYGLISSTTSLAANVGLENLSGTIGNNIPQADVQAGNVAKMFTAVGSSSCSPPVNDICATASSIPAAGTGAGGVSGNNSLASLDGNPTACGVNVDKDVWFSFTPTASVNWNISTCSDASQDTVIEIYDACGGGANLVACSDDAAGCGNGTQSSITQLSLAAGTAYKIRLASKGTGAAGGPFTLVVVQAPLANDACANAIPLAVPSTTPISTLGATVEAPLPPACAGPLGTGAQNFTTFTNGIWYSIVSPTNQTITVDTLSSVDPGDDPDSKLWVWNASAGCSGLVCVTANDDVEGSPFRSKATWVATAGVPYFVLVAPFGNTQLNQNFILNVSGTPTPANDLCSSPTLIAGMSGSTGGTTVGATSPNNTASAAMPSCAAAYSFFDVWFSYTAPCSGQLTLGTCGTYDTLLSVHSTCPTLTLNNQVTGACNNEGPTGCLPGSQLTFAATGGTTYLVRVSGNPGALPFNSFNLTWSLADTSAPTIVTCAPNTTVSADANCQATIPDLASQVNATDACSGVTVTQAPAIGTLVGLGNTSVTLTATDGVGNFSTCTATVSVTDTTAPSISLCSNQQMLAADGSCSAVMPDMTGTVSATDNCSGVLVSQTPLSGSTLPLGTTTVNFVVSDGAGNSTGCSTTVTVIDVTGPNVTGCPPGPVNLNAGSGCTAALPSFSGVTANDNCDGSLPVTQSPPAGALVGLGTTIVTMSATDGAGNGDSCTVVVFVSSPDTDGDGTVDCADGCPNDANKIEPGQCGCGVAETDTDADSIADCTDNCDTVPNLTQEDFDNDGAGDVCDNCVTIANPSQADCNNDSIGDACAIAAGVPDCNLNGIPDPCDLTSGNSQDLNNNQIPDECEVNGGTPYCFGYAGCPCGNNSVPGSGQGCRNSTGLGARMFGSGMSSITADTLLLTVTNLNVPAGGPGVILFFQGDAQTNVPFLDGRRCVAGSIVRLGTKMHTTGTSTYPQAGDPTVHVRGNVNLPGVRNYQGWYRNSAGPCGTGSNLSNGLSVIWAP